VESSYNKRHEAKVGLRVSGKRVVIWLCIGTFASLGLGFLELAVAGFLQVFFKTLGLMNIEGQEFSFLERFQPTPLELGLVLIAIGFLKAIGQFTEKLASNLVQSIFNARLRLLALYEMLLMPEGKYVSIAKVNLRIGELFPKAAGFTGLFLKTICSGIQTISILCFMFYVQWQLTLVGFFGALTLGLTSKWLNRRINILAWHMPKEQAIILRGIERISRNWLFVKILRIGPTEFRKLSQNVLRYAALSVRIKDYQGVALAVPPFLGILLLMLIIVVGMQYLVVPTMTLLTFLYLFLRFIQHLGQISVDLSALLETYPNFRPVIEFYQEVSSRDTEKVVKLADHISIFGSIKGVISFDGLPSVKAERPILPGAGAARAPVITLAGVTFSYTGRNEDAVISNVNINVKSGEQFGIIGKSGSGKSTLLAIILGVLKPQSGAVKIDDGNPEAFIGRDDVYIGYVGAEPFLIEGTIRDNLRYGLSLVKSDAEYYAALDKARLLQTIEEKTGSLDFRINENGDGLSAGQKQRLALARALLSDPQLLVLDEATANLDRETEAEIAETILQLKKLTTVIIVSHRPGIIKYADTIYDFEKLSEGV